MRGLAYNSPGPYCSHYYIVSRSYLIGESLSKYFVSCCLCVTAKYLSVMPRIAASCHTMDRNLMRGLRHTHLHHAQLQTQISVQIFVPMAAAVV